MLRGLPEELWSLIWQFLPLSALFTVTHVCRTWRTLAVNDPSLWPTEISTGDGLPGVCDICATRPGSPYSPIWELVCAILPRSAPLPLTLSFNVCGKHMERPLAQRLTEVSSRLSALQVHGVGTVSGWITPSVRDAGDLLGHILPALHLAPVLRSISLRGYNDGHFYFPLLVEVPALEDMDLDLCPGILWPPPLPSRLYSKLRSMTIIVEDFGHILTIPNACPGVRSVTVTGPYHRVLHWTKPAEHARFPAALTIRGVLEGPLILEQPVKEVLQDAYFADVTLKFGTASIDAMGDLIPFFQPVHATQALAFRATRAPGMQDPFVAAKFPVGPRMYIRLERL
ncbi:hypothetical protein AURDEDRAFT_176308 [Auricularia subglabra TFB-10046 SS5]|nr:hypothetical protein AURDEDRAFT_176308 [Auricularia subglabra TFB-10046 SS5]